MRILVVAAMDKEIEVVREVLKQSDDYKITSYLGFDFFIGTLMDKEIILVKSGVGRVNSAILITVAKTIFEFDLVSIIK